MKDLPSRGDGGMQGGQAPPTMELQLADDIGAEAAPLSAPGHFGWVPDLPDIRDFTDETSGVGELLARRGLGGGERAELPAKADLRKWCSPVEDQGQLGSCTAQAAVAIVEYFERRAFGKHLDGSRLFVYKVTRQLLGWSGDTGAYLRSAMGAVTLFGVPPEKHWPYDIARYEADPPTFVFALAQNYQAQKYYRLDPAGTTGDALLRKVREHAAAGLPAMFGFSVYSSISKAGTSGKIPFPKAGEKLVGGHAVTVVGYDDAMQIGGLTGALLIRNSWGRGWGDQGYGWLPYEYVLRGLTRDFWVLTKSEWTDADGFYE